MVIGVDIRTLMDTNYSGVSLYTLDLVREILKQDRENKYILYYNSAKDIANRIPKFEGNVEIINTRYPNKIFNYILQKILKYPKIDKILGNIDIFFSPHINFTSLSSDAKSILTIHDLSFLRYPHFFSERKNIWHKLLNVKKIIKNTDKIIAISNNTKNDIINLCKTGSEKTKVIYSGISEKYRVIEDDEKLKQIKEKYDLPDKFILHIGTIEPRKNIEAIIKSFDKAEIGDYELVIVGGLGWKNEKIFETLRRANKIEKIRFLGYIIEDEKPYLYNLASLFVFPSFYEGFGFPPLEAQKCGTPVIASNISSIPEALGDSALLIDPGDINSISIVVEEVVNNKNLRKELIKRGLKNAEKFIWQKTAKEYIDLFNSFNIKK